MKMTILLIDDDNISNFLMTRYLENFSSVKEIHSAENGQEAIKLIRSFYKDSKAWPDIIFLDINMPIMDGFAFLDAFYKLDFPNLRNPKIVIVSSSDSSLDKMKAKVFGINDYLVKPISEEMLDKLLQA